MKRVTSWAGSVAAGFAVAAGWLYLTAVTAIRRWYT